MKGTEKKPTASFSTEILIEVSSLGIPTNRYQAGWGNKPFYQGGNKDCNFGVWAKKEVVWIRASFSTGLQRDT